jgi:hypothetical protein
MNFPIGSAQTSATGLQKELKGLSLQCPAQGKSTLGVTSGNPTNYTEREPSLPTAWSMLSSCCGIRWGIPQQSTSTRCVDRLEADDLIGMMVSSGKAIGITVDKDLRQVPGWHWNPDKETEPVLVSQEDADKFFYQQWMTGDSTDNIWGLWKVGPAKAKKVLDSNPREEWEQVILKMYEEEDWDKRPENKRPTLDRTEFALSQARCVRILRDGDYNKETKEISLWTPTWYKTTTLTDKC